MSQRFCLKVWGDWACFSRPELKVERVSYPVITPSAARAIFEAIFWKPPVQYIIEKIEVLNPIGWANIRRNEVDKVVSTPTRQAMAGETTSALGLLIEDNRQQRAAMVLKDVAYRIYARMVIDEAKMGPDDEGPGKFLAMFERRAKRGQCFNQPYLGCREFSAHWELLDLSQPLKDKPIPHTEDLNWMLYDMDFSNLNDIKPMFFNPKMVNGIIHVPAPDSPEVKR